MSASEWARIVDERDEAAYYVEQLLKVLEERGLSHWKKVISEAKVWLDEFKGEDE